MYIPAGNTYTRYGIRVAMKVCIKAIWNDSDWWLLLRLLEPKLDPNFQLLHLAIPRKHDEFCGSFGRACNQATLRAQSVLGTCTSKASTGPAKKPVWILAGCNEKSEKHCRARGIVSRSSTHFHKTLSHMDKSYWFWGQSLSCSKLSMTFSRSQHAKMYLTKLKQFRRWVDLYQAAWPRPWRVCRFSGLLFVRLSWRAVAPSLQRPAGLPNGKIWGISEVCHDL